MLIPAKRLQPPGGLEPAINPVHHRRWIISHRLAAIFDRDGRRDAERRDGGGGHQHHHNQFRRWPDKFWKQILMRSTKHFPCLVRPLWVIGPQSAPHSATER